MRVGHLIPTLGLGGAEELLFKLIRNQRSKEVCHTIFVLGSRSSVDDRFNTLQIEIVYLDILDSLRRGQILSLVKKSIRLNQLVRTKRITLLHSWLPVADLTSLLIIQKGLKRVWGLYAGRTDRSAYSILVYLAMRMCGIVAGWIPDLVISCSYHAAKIFPKVGYPVDKIVVVPIGFDTRVFHEAQDKSQEEIIEKVRVGMVARFDPFKDFDMFFRGLRWAEQRGCLLEVHLSGGYGIDVSNRALAELISKSGLKADIVLHGRVENLKEFYHRLDLFILASKGEGFPNVLGEAMSCCVECISTDVGDARQIVGKTGSIIPTSDSRALGIAITKWAKRPLRDRTYRAQLARKRIQNNFDIREMVARYERLYESVSQKSRCK